MCASAVQTILSYYGIDEEEQKLMIDLNTQNDGTLPKNIISLFERFEFKVKFGQTGIKGLKLCIDKNLPILISLQAYPKTIYKDWEKNNDSGHYVVVIGYTSNTIIFSDPSCIYDTYLTNDELLARWHDIDQENNKLKQHYILPYGKRIHYNSNLIKHMK
jgi:ABC-type bacteriocin/lantibiotic exporter with double-glycine peptidase domain